ncbi:MAG: hypothetical protein QOD02_2996 [Mycobacterium sp.]|nr:hypothetical protein [Mycobacterium sp.]MDT7768801.1 hypothetical protein [Mycobacterium sp.]
MTAGLGEVMACIIELEMSAGPGPGQFITRVVDAPSGGEPSAVVQLDVEGLLRDRYALEMTVLASAVAGRRIASAPEQELRRVGLLLFDALLSGPVLGTYRASVGIAQQRDEPLRLVLRLADPKLAALPWEALFDPEIEAYICRKEPLVRHVPAPFTPQPLKVAPPLRILGLIASPRGMPALDVTAERDNLSRALAGPISEGLIHLEWLEQATWETVQEKLLSDHWHVLHFVGHGDYDLKTDQGVLALVGPGGQANLVGADQLVDLLNQAQPTPRLVVLNSCSSGEEGTQDLFSGTAAALVHSGIGAVAAMQFTVSDPAAIAFAQGFYVAIAHGRSVDEASRSGRIGILQAPGTLEWVTPVLYVRGENTQLFRVDEGARRSTRSRVRRKKIATAPRPDKNSSSPDDRTAPARTDDDGAEGSSPSPIDHLAAERDTHAEQTESLSPDKRQIPQREEPSREPRRTGKRRRLVSILVVTGVLAVAGAVLLAKFLHAPSPTLPPLVKGADYGPFHQTCDQGFSRPDDKGFGSHSGRGTGVTSCLLAQSVLDTYWLQYGRPTSDPRTVSAPGALDCKPNDGVQCDGTDFVMQCAGDPAGSWISCTGGKNARVYLF